MNEAELTRLFETVVSGGCSVREAVDRIKNMPAEQMGFACLDHHRALRTGVPEVVFGENKSGEQIASILAKIRQNSKLFLATRVSPEKAATVQDSLSGLEYHPEARMLTPPLATLSTDQGRGTIAVISAGTSDIPVAEEAYLTVRCLGHSASKVFDIGVAGLHRLFDQRQLLTDCSVLIVVAGMEGALPSVVGGLVDKPVIAVPTSVGYGTGLGGFAALLGMLNSCAPGVAVVNIDNGFGAGCFAATVNRRQKAPGDSPL